MTKEEAQKLPAVMNIGNVAEVKEQLNTVLQGDAKVVELDASEVTDVDTAGVQLLRAFKSAVEAAEAELRWVGVSTELEGVVANSGWSLVPEAD